MDLKFKVFKLQGPKHFCYVILCYVCALSMPAKNNCYIHSLIPIFISNSYIHISVGIIYLSCCIYTLLSVSATDMLTSVYDLGCISLLLCSLTGSVSNALNHYPAFIE